MSVVDFKMFSVILFFTAPMWVLTFLGVCLLVLRFSKYTLFLSLTYLPLAGWDFVKVKLLFEDLAFYQLLLVIPQPIYYFLGELFKIFGPYHDLYYPNKSSIIGQFILIIVLYTPFFVNYYMVKRVINTNIRILHPSYNFETGQIDASKYDTSPSVERLTGESGGFRTYARPEDEHRDTIQSNDDDEEHTEEFYSRREEKKVNMFPASNRGTREISDDDKKGI